MRAPRTVRSPIGVSLPSLEGAAFPAVETTEQADFIDIQYGPGGRVVPGAEMDAKWTAESKKRCSCKGERVPGKGIEPLRPYEHSALNAACLPVPPPRRATAVTDPSRRLLQPRCQLVMSLNLAALAPTGAMVTVIPGRTTNESSGASR